MKTSDLIGSDLDSAVGIALKLPKSYWYDGVCAEFSSNCIHGDSIIDREMIATYPMPGGAGGLWRAELFGRYLQSGPTRLVAAMRCFVASTLGDEIDETELRGEYEQTKS